MSSSFIQLGEETFELKDSVESLTKFFSYYDSGLTPQIGSGVILHRYGFGSEQIVYQFEPQFRGVVYKQDEGSDEDETWFYNLPFPYVVIAIAYQDDVFVGIRHYYSPTPITSLDQQLYMPSLPNTNCKGYNTTSVGWVCLYHHTHDKFTTLQQKLNYASERYDPISEPYNYGNMGSTDGHGFYREQKKPATLWKPGNWQAKGEKEGLDWVLSADWIPILTAGNGSLAYDKAGHPHTLREALYEKHYPYYRTEGAVLLNEYAKLEDEKAKMAFQSKHMRRALLGGIDVGEQDEPEPQVVALKDWIKSIHFSESDTKQILGFGIVQNCYYCGSEHSFSDFQAPNVVVSITGIRSQSHKSKIGWYCYNCVNAYCCSIGPKTPPFYIAQVDDGGWQEILREDAKHIYGVKSVDYYCTNSMKEAWIANLGTIATDIIGEVPLNYCKNCGIEWIPKNPSLYNVYDSDGLEVVGCRKCKDGTSAYDIVTHKYVNKTHSVLISARTFDLLDQPPEIADEAHETFRINSGLIVTMSVKSLVDRLNQKFDVNISPSKIKIQTIFGSLFNILFYDGSKNEEQLKEILVKYIKDYDLALAEGEEEPVAPKVPKKKAAAKKPALGPKPDWTYKTLGTSSNTNYNYQDYLNDTSMAMNKIIFTNNTTQEDDTF